MVNPDTTESATITTVNSKMLSVPTKNPLCKCLFGPPDPAQSLIIAKLAKECINNEQKRFKRKWNFDVEDDSIGVKESDEDSTVDTEASSLSKSASKYRWKKVENENIPYFYYKPYARSQPGYQYWRPLNCHKNSERVPSTPVKRRYENWEILAARTQLQIAQDTSALTKQSNRLTATKPSVSRRLDFFGKVTLTNAPKKKVSVKTVPKLQVISQTTNSIPALVNEDKEMKKTTFSGSSSKEGTQKGQKLITELMFKRKTRSPSSKGSNSDEAAATSSTVVSGTSGESRSPFGSPVARRDRVSSQ